MDNLMHKTIWPMVEQRETLTKEIPIPEAKDIFSMPKYTDCACINWVVSFTLNITIDYEHCVLHISLEHLVLLDNEEPVNLFINSKLKQCIQTCKQSFHFYA